MQDFLSTEFYNNTITDWGASLLIILGSIIAGKIIYWFFGSVVKKITTKTKTKIDDIIADMIGEPIILALAIISMWFGLHRLEFSDDAVSFMTNVYHVLIAINVTWLIARLVDAIIKEYIVPLTLKTESDLDDQILPIVRKCLRSAIWIFGMIVALNNAGYDVGALIAGLGIGGLALAMAAKDSVANIFGGIMIFTDKPFKIGDRIKINGFDGSITEIGIRTSRMRTLEGRLVTIPNSLFTGDMVENVSEEPNRKVVLNLGLTYDTNSEQIEKGIELLKDIAINNQALEENVSVGFNAFGDFSLGIVFIYYIKKDGDILGTQTAINLEILKQFGSNGLEMAFPTQTIYNINENK